MKRLVVLLIVAVMCLSLCTCQSGLDPKYQAVIDQLENGNYQNAIDLIENMAQADGNNNSNTDNENNSESSDKPELTPDQIAWKTKVVGSWFPDKSADEAGHTGFTVKEDGTCTVDGQNYTWTMGNTSETSAWLNVMDGQTKLYGLQMSIHADYGYKRASLFKYTSEYNSTSTDGAYYHTEEYTVVEITTDNWQDYFEVAEVCSTEKNAFGEISEFVGCTYFRLKDSCGVMNSAVSSGGTEYHCISTCQNVTVNLTDMTYTPVGEVHNTSVSESVSEWRGFTDVNGDRYYGVTIGSFRAYDVNKELTDVVWRPTDIQILRAEGTLYLMK